MKFIVREVFLWLLGDAQLDDAETTADAYAETTLETSPQTNTKGVRSLLIVGQEPQNTQEQYWLSDAKAPAAASNNLELGPDHSARELLQRFIQVGKQYRALKTVVREFERVNDSSHHGATTWMNGGLSQLQLTSGAETANHSSGENSSTPSSLYRKVVLESLRCKLLKEYEDKVLELEEEVLAQDTISLSYAWAQVEPYSNKFTVMSQLVFDIVKNDYIGGQILDVMYRQMENVTMTERETIQTLARPLRRTIIQQITSWVTFGEIVDPTEEFFIKERRTSRHILQSYKNLGADASYIGEARELEWSHRFYIDWASVPKCIMDDALCLRIFFMGKATRLLQQTRNGATANTSGDSLTQDFTDPFLRILEFFQRQSSHDALAFECAFHRMSALIQNRLLAILKKDGLLEKQFAAIRNYMLLGRGELFRAFVEQVDPLVNKLNIGGSKLYDSESQESALMRITQIAPTVEEEIRQGPWAASAVLSSSAQDECFNNVDVLIALRSFGLIFGQAGASSAGSVDAKHSLSQEVQSSLKLVLLGTEKGILAPDSAFEEGSKQLLLDKQGLLLASSVFNRDWSVAWFRDGVNLDNGFRLHSTMSITGTIESASGGGFPITKNTCTVWILLHTDPRGQYLLPRLESNGDFGSPSIAVALKFTPESNEQGKIRLSCNCHFYNSRVSGAKASLDENVNWCHGRFYGDTHDSGEGCHVWNLNLHTQLVFSQSPSRRGQFHLAVHPLASRLDKTEVIDLSWTGDMESYLQTSPAARSAYVGLAARVDNSNDARQEICLSKWSLSSTHPYFEKQVPLLVRYRVPWPQSLVFGSRLNHAYEEIFRYLFSIRRCLCRFHQWWKDLLFYSRSSSSKGQYRNFWLLRHRINYTIEMLYYYMQVDVIDTAYTTLLNEVSQATNFESLMKAHNTFIHTVVQKSFLSNRMITGSITKILSIAFEFEEIMNDILDHDSEPPSTSDTDNKIKDLQRRFERECRFLFEMSSVLSPAVGSDVDMDHTRSFSALLTRLDFNNWFSAKSHSV